MSTDTRVELGEIEALGRHAGLAAAFAALLGPEPDELCPAHGCVVLPKGTAATVRRWRVDGVLVSDVTFTAVPNLLAETAGLEVLRVSPAGTRSGDPGPLAHGLAAARLGVTRRLLDLAIAHLQTRLSGGEPLIRRQLVQGTIADAIADLEVCAHLLAEESPCSARTAALHARISVCDWSISTLFGASGYIADHPVHELYASELVRDAWVDPCPGAEWS